MTEKYIKDAVSDAERRIERKIKDRFSQVSGYNPLTIGQQLGQTSDSIAMTNFFN
jgi:hypothetical protein